MSTQRSSLIGIRIHHLEGFDRARQEVERIADDLAQQFLRRGQCAFGGNHRRGGAVMGGARLLHIRDGNEPDLIARLGLLELASHRDQRDLLGLEIILCAEHVEIALRDPLHQVLLRGLVVRLGLRHLRIRALQAPPSSPSETNSA